MSRRIAVLENVMNPTNIGAIFRSAAALGMDAVLLPRFSCHILRHTFTTRMCEAGVNVKVMQEVLGHKDISTTMNIYADVTKELETTEFENLDRHFTAWMKDADENGNVERVS